MHGPTAKSPRVADDEHAALDCLIRGFQVSRMIRLAADLRIADRIAPSRCVAVDALSASCAVLPGPLLRVLRALAAFGIFRLDTRENVAHTARSMLLRTDAPNTLHYAARFWTGPGVWNAWGELDAALIGGIPHEAAWKATRFDYLRSHPAEARSFDEFMAHVPDERHEAVAAAYDFSRVSRIVDIGGGSGSTLQRILAGNPRARGLVFDLPHVIEAIEPAARMGDRIGVVAGDFRESVPADADVYLLVRVLHDWPDEECLRILRNCRMAMPAHARLLIAELLLDPEPSHGPASTYLIDTQMMAMFGTARERTRKEFEQLLAAVPMTVLRVLPTSSSISIVEAEPA